MPTQVAEDDFALVERMGAGDTRALAQFADRHGAVVYTLLIKMLRDAPAAEQLYVESFFEVYRRAEVLAQRHVNPLLFITSVARRRALALSRTRGRAPADFTPVGHERSDANEREYVRQCRSAMDRLEPEQRRCVELAYYQGLNADEMADRLQKPRTVTRDHLRRGLTALRNYLSSD